VRNGLHLPFQLVKQRRSEQCFFSSLLIILTIVNLPSLSSKQPSNTMSSPEHESAEKSVAIGCGILGRYPIISVVTFAATGIGIGIGLSSWDPDDADTKSTVLKWIGLVGDVFIRALKSVVLPLVFVNVAVSIVDMMMMGRASTVGVTTIILYTCTTLMASIIGLISILSFQSLFKQGEFDEEPSAFVALGCTAPGALLSEMADGSLMCSPDANLTSPFSQFEIIDLTANLVRATGGGLADLSMSDTIYEGVFMKLITDNIFYSFVDGNFASVSPIFPH
jgi:hypothetical protein